MTATAETLRKLDSLNEQDFNMIVSLIDRLSVSQDTNNDLETFRQIISAFVGGDWRTIYRHALDNGFRFLSYGDSSLLFRR